MKTFKLLFSAVSLLALGACAGVGKTTTATSPQPGLDTQLKVTSGVGRLKAKLVLKNTGQKEIVISDLNPANFKVEMLDGKAMTFKGNTAPAQPVKLLPGQTVETAFNLQDSYPFWDRRTKHKIRYDGPNLKTNTVNFWF